LRDLEWKESTAAEMPFGRMKVRLKREIVTMGVPGTDPNALVGTYVAQGLERPDRGAGRGGDRHAERLRDGHRHVSRARSIRGPRASAISPRGGRQNRDRFHNKRIAMFCTGGIRCEKSTAYLKAQGVEEVYHLQGGILKYLEEVPEDQSLWQGGCFVFDERVAVGHGLRELPFSLCRACRRPLTPEDRARPEFEEGVACHRCVGEYSEDDRARFRERQRQVKLAEARGMAHLGG
jgi:UPF0176 protein